MTLTLADDRPPVPPADLILRVTKSFVQENVEAAQTGFDLGGLDHLRAFERGLATVGRSFDTFSRLLDFGCGCGRFLRHLGPLANNSLVEVHGTDIDAEMIGWCIENIPYGHFAVGPHEPPLPYDDGTFDLVINHSVFTHLDERYQDMWLAELQRVTQPGAILLLTVEGTDTWNRTRAASKQVGESTDAWQAELESNGILFIADDHFVGSTHPDFYHSTIHAPWYIFEHWATFFEIAAYMPLGSDSQDLVVLRRRADDAPIPPTIGHAAAHSAPSDSVERSTPGRSRQRGAERAKRLVLSAARAVEKRYGERADLPDPMMRELTMIRAGLYEQGNRISVIATELRREIESLREPREPS